MPAGYTDKTTLKTMLSLAEVYNKSTVSNPCARYFYPATVCKYPQLTSAGVAAMTEWRMKTRMGIDEAL